MLTTKDGFSKRQKAYLFPRREVYLPLFSRVHISEIPTVDPLHALPVANFIMDYVDPFALEAHYKED